MIKIEHILQFFREHKTIIRLNISILLSSEKLNATCTRKSKFTNNENVIIIKYFYAIIFKVNNKKENRFIT